MKCSTGLCLSYSADLRPKVLTVLFYCEYENIFTWIPYRYWVSPSRLLSIWVEANLLTLSRPTEQQSPCYLDGIRLCLCTWNIPISPTRPDVMQRHRTRPGVSFQLSDCESDSLTIRILAIIFSYTSLVDLTMCDGILYAWTHFFKFLAVGCITSMFTSSLMHRSAWTCEVVILIYLKAFRYLAGSRIGRILLRNHLVVRLSNHRLDDVYDCLCRVIAFVGYIVYQVVNKHPFQNFQYHDILIMSFFLFSTYVCGRYTLWWWMVDHLWLVVPERLIPLLVGCPG